MPFAFHAGGLVDDEQDTVTFADRFGGTFGDACAAGDAIFCDFHGHGRFLLDEFLTCAGKIPEALKMV